MDHRIEKGIVAGRIDEVVKCQREKVLRLGHHIKTIDLLIRECPFQAQSTIRQEAVCLHLRQIHVGYIENKGAIRRKDDLSVVFGGILSPQDIDTQKVCKAGKRGAFRPDGIGRFRFRGRDDIKGNKPKGEKGEIFRDKEEIDIVDCKTIRILCFDNASFNAKTGYAFFKEGIALFKSSARRAFIELFCEGDDLLSMNSF